MEAETHERREKRRHRSPSATSSRRRSSRGGSGASSSMASSSHNTRSERSGSSRSSSRHRRESGDERDSRRGRRGSTAHVSMASTDASSSSLSRTTRNRRSSHSRRELDDVEDVENDAATRRSRNSSSRRSRSKSRDKDADHAEDAKSRHSKGRTLEASDKSKRERKKPPKSLGSSSERKISKRGRKPSRRNSTTGLDSSDDDDRVDNDDDDDDDDDGEEAFRGKGTLGLAHGSALRGFSLSSALGSLSRELLWKCMTSRMTGSLMEAVTGAGFKALAPQTIGADDEKLLQRRKQALAELPADAVLQIRVLAAENLPTWESKRVRAVVRVSIVDASSGEYLTKRRRDDDAIQEHERASRAKAKRDASGATHLSWETIKCGRVCQQITEPVCISVESGADSQSLRWDTQSPLVFNIPVKHALDPHAMVFFEILEFGPGLDRHLLRRGNGFRRVAWAFLKLVSATGTPNIHIPRMEGQGKEHMATRLQVYDFPPESWVHRTLESFFERDLVQGSGPRVFNAFRFKERKRLPGHLDVEVGACARPARTMVSDRPKHAFESERAQEELPVAALLAGKTVGSGTGEIGKEGEGAHGSMSTLKSARRHRMKTEPCLIPTSLVARLEAGTNGCLHVQFSTDGQYLAAACQDGASGFPIRIFAVSTMKLAFTLHGHQNLVYELAWQRPAEEDDPTMLMLASASADGTARLWAVPALRDALRGPDEPAGEAGEDDSGRSDDELLGSEKAETRRREKSKERRRKVERHRSHGPAKPRCLHVLQHAPPTYVYTARFHPSARRPAILATGGYDGFVRLWDCSTGTLLGKLDRGRAHHKARVNALCFTNDGNRIISGDGDGVVNVWRLETGRQAANPDAWHLARKLDDPDFRGKSITSVQVHPVERLLLVSAQQNTIRLFELRRYTRVHDGFIGAPVSHSLVRACFSPDGQYVLSGAEDGKPHLWNTNTSMAVASKTWRYGFPKPLCAASWHPHEHLVAFCAFDGRFPVLMYEALRDTRDVDAQPIKLAGELPMDDDDGDLVFEGGATRRRSVSETAQVLSAIRDERTRRLSAKLDALDLSDDENTRESANAMGAGATGAGAVSQLRGIDALRERFMQRRLAQQGQGRRHRSPERSGLLGPSSNQESSSSDDEESKSSDDSDSI